MRDFFINSVVTVVFVTFAALAAIGAVSVLGDDSEYARLCAQQESNKVRDELLVRIERLNQENIGLESRLTEALKRNSETLDCVEAYAKIVSKIAPMTKTNSDAIEELQDKFEAMSSYLAEIKYGAERDINYTREDLRALRDELRSSCKTASDNPLSLEGFVEVFGREVGAACWDQAVVKARFLTKAK